MLYSEIFGKYLAKKCGKVEWEKQINYVCRLHIHMEINRNNLLGAGYC